LFPSLNRNSRKSFGRGERMMKKTLVYFFLLVIFLVIDSQEVSAVSTVKYIPVAINDQIIHFPDAIPVVQDQTTYVPVRFFSDFIPATLSVIKPGVISLKSKGKSLILYTSQNEIHFSNGKKIKIKLFVQDGRTYAPIRSLSEYFGFQVHYLSEGPIVRLVNTETITERQLFLEMNESKIISFYQKANQDQRPKVYLTFDDGPNPGIKDILDILKNKKAKATFFMIEPQMRSYPNDVRRLVAEGHYPALHSVSHNKQQLYGGKPYAVATEMLKTRKTLYDLTGVKSMLTRVPYGSKPYMVKSFRDELARYQFKMWDWDIDTLDWENQSNPQQIYANMKAGFQQERNGNKSIVILFHINKGTVEALPEIIDYIYAQGFQCAAYNPSEHFVVNFWDDARL
jgi:peptidoglycan-N-acetylglucosamine deacetylase